MSEPAARGGGPAVGTAIVELTDPPAALDLSGADRWRILLLAAGVPRALVRLPSPGRQHGDGLLRAAVLANGAEAMTRDEATERLRARFGPEPRAPARPSCSVVVCTHRRPAYVPDLLAALGALDPAPDEIVIVDNDPGPADCRAQVEAAGHRYVREDRRGLDRARTAGLHAARCELVAFTDDDCVPSRGWLARLPGMFADPTVAAVTGPAFAYELATPPQARFEEAGGFTRGWGSRVLDLTTIDPLAAGQAGAGANMIFSRAGLLALGDPFPPELDAGTATQSGGDMYALYRLLAAGRRIRYDPGTWVLHQHRPDARALHHAIWGYGVGLSAVLAKALVEERELAAPATWWWLWRQYRATVARALRGAADPVEVRIAWDYLRGGFQGAAAWRRARALAREEDAAGAPPRPSTETSRAPSRAQEDPGAPRERPSAGGAPAGEPPALSVVIPTAGRTASLRRTLEALAADAANLGEAVEIVIADDTGPGVPPVAPPWPRGLEIRVVRTGAVGAAGARNAAAAEARGGVLLFLDDDLVPERGLLRGHIEGHADGRERVLIGYSAPRPPACNLAALGALLWWEDHFTLKRELAAMTFVEMLSGNMSVRRATFERLGPFDEAFGRCRREDWEWGTRVLRAGVEVAYDENVAARHEFSITTRGRLAAARLEGEGDALLLERVPEALASLPRRAGRRELAARPARGLARLALGSAPGRAAVPVVLDALEGARWRASWQRLFLAAQSAAYDAGFRTATRGAPRSPGVVPVLQVELERSAALPAPDVAAPEIEALIGARPVARVRPVEGRWHRSLADRVIAAVPGDRLAAAAVRGPRPATGRERLDGLAVMFGPARHGGDARRRRQLAAAGAEVAVLGGAAREHWTAIAEALGASGAGHVAIALPGAAPGPSALAAAREGLDGERVAAVAAAALAPEEPAGALSLLARATTRRYAALPMPPELLVLSATHMSQAGGPDPRLARLGPWAPMLDLLERLLDAGLLIGWRDVSGIELGTAWRAHRRAQSARLEHDRLVMLAREGSGAGRALARAAWGARRSRRGALLAAAGAAGAARGALSRAAPSGGAGVRRPSRWRSR